MIVPATGSRRYDRPVLRQRALASGGPGRAPLLLRLYRWVDAAGGTVWDCDQKFGELDAAVELEGGRTHPLWAQLEAIDRAYRHACEVCGETGELRTGRCWWRVLCGEHEQAIEEGVPWDELWSDWWPRMVDDIPEGWRGAAGR